MMYIFLNSESFLLHISIISAFVIFSSLVALMIDLFRKDKN